MLDSQLATLLGGEGRKQLYVFMQNMLSIPRVSAGLWGVKCPVTNAAIDITVSTGLILATVFPRASLLVTIDLSYTFICY